MWRLAKFSCVGKSWGSLTKARARVVSVAELVHLVVVVLRAHDVQVHGRLAGAAARDASTEAPKDRPRRPICRDAAIVEGDGT
jgi:hypothetical protein